jgi:type VI secretion system secreted protein VgrG
MASDTTHVAGAEGTKTYTNSFTCIPDSVAFRPQRTTPKPVVKGLQTAMVVGPPGEEIFTDKHARVKVQFHWDREGSRDEHSSCWIRVSQAYAGKGWGSVSIPRIGQEVIVDFLEGDVDRPIIVGRVYNAEQMPPYELPANKVVTGLKSNSSPGGGGYNEIIVNDTKGKELMQIHAQKDLDATIENNETRTVVGGTQTVTVKGNATPTVQAGKRAVEVSGGDYSATSTDAIKLHGIGKGVSILGESEGVGIVGTSKGVSVTGTGKGVTINGDGGPGVGIVGKPNFDAHGVSSASLTGPEVFIGDKSVKIHGTKIELATAGGSITIDAAGVTIAGNMIKSSASGTHDITGALVKIN